MSFATPPCAAPGVYQPHTYFMSRPSRPAGELFAESPLPNDGSPLTRAVEPVIDSSRYFVLRIQASREVTSTVLCCLKVPHGSNLTPQSGDWDPTHPLYSYLTVT